jgi:hypothetical protein
MAGGVDARRISKLQNDAFDGASLNTAVIALIHENRVVLSCKRFFTAPLISFSH